MNSSSKKPVEDYINGVLSGEIVVGRLVRLAVERHLRDLENGAARGLYFSQAAADHVIDFFSKYLRHSKGEWARQRVRLEPWQMFLLSVVFGWKREDGTRRFRTSYNEIARKNGKSFIASGVGNYLFIADDEPGAEVYTAATKRDQARIVHSEAVRMIKASPVLRNRVKVCKDNLSVEGTASKFEPLGADSDGTDGLNVHGGIIDELHAHKNRDMWDVLDTATGSRRQPMLFAITTAGFSRHSICWEQRDYGVKILEGTLEDDTFFAWIATIDEEDDWTDPKCWIKANPNLGVSAKLDDLERKAKKAKETPAAQNNFRRKHLNQWTQQDVRWLSMESWNACAGVTLDESLKGKQCWAGLDLATTNDIAALCLLFPIDDVYIARWRFWLPRENAKERQRRDRVPYEMWIEQGKITATEGDWIDYGEIRAEINRFGDIYAIEEIAVDRWNATQLVTQLQGDGFEVVLFGQGFASMTAPTKELQRLIGAREFEHDGDPVAAWMASNVAVELDAAGNIKPSKKKSTEKIDGIVAGVMALGLAMVRDEGEYLTEIRFA